MDLLECPVCLERFTCPQVLPGCGHTFCSDCVRQICSGEGEPHCPTCRLPFRPAEVRSNFALQALLDEHAAPGAAPEDQRLDCPPPSSSRSRVEDACRRRPDWRQDTAALGLPPRLEELVVEEERQIGLRIFLVDNSGSTHAYDGKLLRPGADGRLQSHPCTRWEEIKQMAVDHAEWNARTGTSCEFVLLNPGPPPFREGTDYQRLDARRGDAQEQVAALRRMLDMNGPRGATPLADRVHEIYRRVSTEHGELVGAGHRVILVIATDGLPTGPHSNKSTPADRRQLVEVLRRLMLDLPVSVVIRLCTDDGETVDFYNEVEGELELPLDVLDDLVGEAREIQRQGNGWFAYSPALHRLREGGTFNKVLDLLDERRLSASEAALFAQLLLRGRDTPPLPLEPQAFCEAAEELLRDAAQVYDPRAQRMGPAVDLRGLQQAVGGRPWGPLQPLVDLFVGPLQMCSHRAYEESGSEFASDSE